MSQKAAVLRDVEPDVLAAVEALRERGLRLALITNSFAEDVAGWDSSPLHPFFDVALFSCVAGLAKPDARIYLLACRNLDIAPAHTLFIGDGADDELAGARRAGVSACQALWFLARRQLPAFGQMLAAFGVLLTPSPRQRQHERPLPPSPTPGLR
jgi:putative hydrolase of the HAD superfamily